MGYVCTRLCSSRRHACPNSNLVSTSYVHCAEVLAQGSTLGLMGCDPCWLVPWFCGT